jgi:hypothetical protein
MVCIECSSKMRAQVIPIGRGSKPDKLEKIVYFCDSCKYGVEVTKQHVVCVNHQYEPPPANKKAEVVPLDAAGQAGKGADKPLLT